MERGKVSLQIDTSAALQKIEELTAQLNALKAKFQNNNGAYNLSPQLNTKQIEKALKDLDKAYTKFANGLNEQNNTITDTTLQGIKTQRKAYEEMWKQNMSDAQAYQEKVANGKLNASVERALAGKPQNVQSGAWLLMSNKARQEAAPAYKPPTNVVSQSSLYNMDEISSLQQAREVRQKDFESQIHEANLVWQHNEKIRQEEDAAREKELDKLRKAIDKEMGEREKYQEKIAKADEKARIQEEKEAEQAAKKKQREEEQAAKESEKLIKQKQREEEQAQRQAEREQRQREREAKQAIREQERLEREARQAAIRGLQNQIATAVQWERTLNTVNQAFQSGINLYQQFSGVGRSILSGIEGSANQLFGILGVSVDTILEDSVAQEEKLQLARIGFKNMFGQDTVEALEEKVRTTAAQSPGLNSGDLADYIAQLGAVATDADQAYNVTMGILKTVQYGGGDAASEMNYIIKNIRDVMAKGKSTQMDIQQFNRAMPLLTKALEGVGASDFLKDGELTITKDNAKNLMEAFASLNSTDNPAYDVFSDTAKTWAGVKEEFNETTQNLINSALREVGFYDALQDIMRNGVFPILDDAADFFSDFLKRINNGTNWDEVQAQLALSWDEIVKAAKTFIDGLIEAFGVVDENGNIDLTETIKTLVKMIQNFVEGMLDGAKMIVDMLAWVKNTLGEEGLANLMGGLGWSVTGGGIVSSIASGAGNVIAGAGSLGLQLYENRLLKQLANVQNGGAVSVSTGVLSRANNWIATKTGGSGFSLGKIAGGLGISALSQTIGNLVMDLNLLGDASKAVGATVSTAGTAVGGALMGSMFGPIGTVGGALLGLAAGAASAQAELRKLEVKETNENISAERLSELNDIANQAAELMTAQGSNMDWESDEGKWVKNALIKEMAAMTQEELNEFATSGQAYRRFTELSNMKQRQIAMSFVDNEEGFWTMGGNAVDVIKDNGDGTFTATEWGERLARIIRANNMVGYDDAQKLENASAATLVQDYLEKAGIGANGILTDNQIIQLEESSTEISQRVAASTTAFADTIEGAIEAAGDNINTAIEDANKAGDEAFSSILTMYQTMRDRANAATQYMLNQMEGDEVVDADTVRSLYGDAAGDAVDRWNTHTQGLNGVWDMFNLSRSSLATAFNLSEGTIFSGGTFPELMTRVYKADQALNEMIQAATGEEKETLQAVREALSGNINELNNVKEGDWGALWEILQRINNMLSYYGIHITNSDVTAKAAGGIINQPKVKPIYRAGGGDARGVDTIHAMLQPGEFVQRRSAVQLAGVGVMNALNRGDLSHAYRLLGAKVNTSTDNRKTWSSVDSHNTSQAQTIINNNYGQSARARAYYGARNFMALG